MTASPRSLLDLLDNVEAINSRGLGFRSLAEDIDTTTPAGRLIFNVFPSIAQFELERPFVRNAAPGRMALFVNSSRKIRTVGSGRTTLLTDQTS